MQNTTGASCVQVVLSKLPDAKKTARGWQARCPAHDDRGPSLSISEGRGGRALIRCFASCDVAAIVSALGLRMSNLFPRRVRDDRGPRRRDAPISPSAISDAIAKETARYRSERGIAESERILTRERDEVRRRVGILLGVKFPPLPASVFDGAFGGMERDELWPAVLAHEYERLWIERLDEKPIIPIERASQFRIGVATLIEAQERAAVEMRRIYRKAARDAR